MKVRTVPRPTEFREEPPVPRVLGPTCKRGHERAVHERRYQRQGVVAANRCCMACQSESDQRRRRDIYRHPLPVREPLISQAEMVRRIEAVRATEGFDSRVQPWPALGLAPLRIGRAQDVRRTA